MHTREEVDITVETFKNHSRGHSTEPCDAENILAGTESIVSRLTTLLLNLWLSSSRRIRVAKHRTRNNTTGYSR